MKFITAAQSHVAVSFKIPEYTANVDAVGCLRILEAIRSLELVNKTKFYQAGTIRNVWKSNRNTSKRNNTFLSKSPYAVSKVFAHYATVNYRSL